MFGFFLALSTSVLSCLLLERFAHHLNLMDHPGERKYQTKPVPRAGGLAIFSAILICSFIFRIKWDPFFLMGFALIYSGGLYDDLRTENTVIKKLFFQISGALVGTAGLLSSLNLELGGYYILLAVSSFTLIVLMSNSFNLMDNINGLTAGLSLIICISFYFFNFIDITMLLVISGSLTGFLFRNFPSGKIFLGDQGSQGLGYALSWIAINGVLNKKEMDLSIATFPWAFAVLLMIFLVFFTDTLSVIYIRTKNKVSIFKGDQNHLSHKLVKSGLNKTNAVLFLFAAQTIVLVILQVCLLQTQS